MRLAAIKVGRGERTGIPDRMAIHLVAARYGTTPAAVREWPADDFIDAWNLLGATGR